MERRTDNLTIILDGQFPDVPVPYDIITDPGKRRLRRVREPISQASTWYPEIKVE